MKSVATPSDLDRVISSTGEHPISPGTTESGPTTESGRERRGLAWVIGSFVLCPCHLPLSLGLLSVVAGGTAFGALLHEHIVLAGVVITTVWVFGLWRGLRLLRQPAACAIPGTHRRSSEVMRNFFGLVPHRSDEVQHQFEQDR
ncbi:MAG: hypothetical protein DLM55_05860 [Acidimicrobiales bacterium]|nr:MAG: hypothetical protein DLM55_05860 [Acidimicrobiales bacterium]